MTCFCLFQLTDSPEACEVCTEIGPRQLSRLVRHSTQLPQWRHLSVSPAVRLGGIVHLSYVGSKQNMTDASMLQTPYKIQQSIFYPKLQLDVFDVCVVAVVFPYSTSVICLLKITLNDPCFTEIRTFKSNMFLRLAVRSLPWFQFRMHNTTVRIDNIGLSVLSDQKKKKKHLNWLIFCPA